LQTSYKKQKKIFEVLTTHEKKMILEKRKAQAKAIMTQHPNLVVSALKIIG